MTFKQNINYNKYCRMFAKLNCSTLMLSVMNAINEIFKFVVCTCGIYIYTGTTFVYGKYLVLCTISVSFYQIIHQLTYNG